MPAPPEPGWLRCAPACEDGGPGRPIRSLNSMEEQLEISFGLLRQRLAEVREEICAPEVQQEPSSAVSTRVRAPGEARTDESGPLEVPPALLAPRTALQDSACRSACLAAARAESVAQAVDLVTLSSGQQPLRLHARWMEMVNRGNQVLGTRKSMRMRGREMTSPALEGPEEDLEDKYNRKSQKPPYVLLPHQPQRLIWDMCGLSLIMVDAFLLPLSLAWDLGIEPVDTGTWINCISFFFALAFWTFDIFMNLNTGFYNSGRLVVSRGRIVVQYMKTWMAFDILLITLDAATASYQLSHSEGASLLRSIRALRILRAFRLLRLLKMTRLSAVIEEASIAAGRQWLVLVVAIVNTTLTILICAHVLACFWFWIGRDRMERYQISWLDKVNATDVPGFIQYLHAFQWVLTPPSPPVVAEDSALERIYCIFIVGCTVVVIGSALSKITGTLTELRTINSEGSRRRREVRQYLHAQKVSMELTSRIMRFVDYKLERQSSVALDPSLLSPSLRIELHVSQRGDMLLPHPLFFFTHEVFPEVFAEICGAVEKHVFGKMETVFSTNAWANCMWMTGTGNFCVFEPDSGLERSETVTMSKIKSATRSDKANLITGCHWFAEAALFAEAVTHNCSLKALTFAEAFTLKGSDLAHTLMNSPECTALFCEYGKDVLAKTAAKREEWHTSLTQELSLNCLKQNSYYQEVHPDPTTTLANVNLFEDVKVAAVPQIKESHLDGMKKILKAQQRMLWRGSSSVKGLFFSSERPDDPESQERQVVEHTPTTPRAPNDMKDMKDMKDMAAKQKLLASDQLRELAEGLIKKEVKMSEVSSTLPDCLPELMEKRGSHAIFGQAGERDKSESCCLSLMALLLGSYEDYTRPQAEQARLSRTQWQQLQELVEWTQPSAQKIRAALVLLAIRALGKSQRIVQQLPARSQRPESAVIFLTRNYENVVPSVSALDAEELELISDALEVHKDFNLAQMLQGENVPASVLQLQEVIKRHDLEILRFYILFLLGFMSGLAGGKGSRFMDGRNAGAVIAGITTLLHILDSSPQAIYWSYIELRAQQLALPSGSPEDMALVRLACLARVQDHRGFRSLRSSWELLGLRERDLLVRHFLADGIDEHAFVLEFLPDCVAKSRDNRQIGLPLLLEVLVELLGQLHRTKISDEVKMVSVDLSDMAAFLAVVQNRFVFSTCITRCKIKAEDSRWYLQMTSANWSRSHEADSDTTTLAYGVQELLQRQKFLHEVISSR